MREQRYAGWGGRARRARSSAASSRWPTSRHASRPARSTRGRVSGRQELPRERGQPAHLGGRSLTRPMSHRPRHRRLDHRDQGDPGRRIRAPCAGIGVRRVRHSSAPAAVERTRPRRLVERRDRPSGSPWRPRASTAATIAAVGLTGQMHGAVLLDAADAVLRPAILWNDQRTAAECDADPRRGGPDTADRDHGQ